MENPFRKKPASVDPLQRDLQAWPKWPTFLAKPFADGVCVGVDPTGNDRVRDVFLYRSVPMSNMDDPTSTDEIYRGAASLDKALLGLSQMARPVLDERRASKNSYREFHNLLVTIPEAFRPPRDHQLYDFMVKHMGHHEVPRHILLFGVKALPGLVSRRRSGLRAMVADTVDSVFSGVPLSDYEDDITRLKRLMDNSGMLTPSSEEFAMADAWWNWGRWPDTLQLPHDGHFHSFENADAARMARSLQAQSGKSGLQDCSEWAGTPTAPSAIPGAASFTMATVSSFEGMGFTPDTSPAARWISDLVRLGAAVVSVRGFVEPPKVTRKKANSNKHKYLSDMRSAAKDSGEVRGDQQDRAARIKEVEDYYDSAEYQPDPTIYNMSTVVGFRGVVKDMRSLVGDALRVRVTVAEGAQLAAMAETMLCSPARFNPHLKDAPASMLSYSGIQNLARAGDRTGALLGFTEDSDQPVFIEPMAATREDAAPYLSIVGSTGSGKTYLGQWLGFQFSLLKNARDENTPVVFINLKKGSDLSPFADITARYGGGGRVVNLDDLVGTDGILDPLRTAVSGAEAQTAAVTLLSSLVRLPEHERDSAERALMLGLRYAIDNGARSTGQALRMALAAGTRGLTREYVDSVMDLADSDPRARALVGMAEDGPSLRMDAGLTLVQIRDGSLELTGRNDTLQERLNNMMMKQLIMGSASALMKRQGVIFFDEAHLPFKSNPDDMQVLGRLAREWEVLLVPMTQKASDLRDAGMKAYISRSLVLYNEAEQAEAALDLTGAPVDPSRVRRLSLPDKMPGSEAFNRASMRPLQLPDPDSPSGRRTVRGSVAYFVGLDKTVVPVVCDVPEFFGERATTTGDARRRLESLGRR